MTIYITILVKKTKNKQTLLLVPWRDVQYYRRHFVQGDVVCFISFATCFVDILHGTEHTIRLLTLWQPTNTD